jgi:hypothetical protein
MSDSIARISTLIGDPDRKRFSAVAVAGAYEAAQYRYNNEDNRCYSAAAELLAIDIQRLIEENALRKDGTGVESSEFQDLSAIISARKAQISYLNGSIVSEKRIGSIGGFGVSARKTILPGIND